MDNLEPSRVEAGDLPSGFTSADPNNPGKAEGDQQKQQQMQEQKQIILEQACTQEALARLGRIRMVRESKAKAIENSIVSMAMQNKLPGRITEAKLIEILERGNAQASKSQDQRQINIQRKRYAFDSDDEDDNDEDLL